MEQYFVIKGGIPLVGEVEIGGAKNAALAILAAAIMTDETVTIDNLPNVRDINVLLEAMAAGTPVIAVDATGVRDIVKTKENGILTSEQPEHLAQEVMQVLGDTTFYKSLCHGARKTAAAYEEEQIALSAEHYYMELLNFCHNSYIHAILKLN